MTQEQPTTNKNQQPNPQSSIGKVASVIGYFSLISIALTFGFFIYLTNQPCRYDSICEAPPYFFLLLIIALIGCVLNMVGWLCAKEARTEEQPQVSEETTRAVQLNLTILLLCLGYVLFFVSVVTMGY